MLNLFQLHQYFWVCHIECRQTQQIQIQQVSCSPITTEACSLHHCKAPSSCYYVFQTLAHKNNFSSPHKNLQSGAKENTAPTIKNAEFPTNSRCKAPFSHSYVFQTLAHIIIFGSPHKNMQSGAREHTSTAATENADFSANSGCSLMLTTNHTNPSDTTIHHCYTLDRVILELIHLIILLTKVASSQFALAYTRT